MDRPLLPTPNGFRLARDIAGEAWSWRLTTPEGGAFVYGKAQDGFRNGWFVARGGA